VPFVGGCRLTFMNGRQSATGKRERQTAANDSEASDNSNDNGKPHRPAHPFAEASAVAKAMADRSGRRQGAGRTAEARGGRRETANGTGPRTTTTITTTTEAFLVRRYGTIRRIMLWRACA